MPRPTDFPAWIWPGDQLQWRTDGSRWIVQQITYTENELRVILNPVAYGQPHFVRFFQADTVIRDFTPVRAAQPGRIVAPGQIVSVIEDGEPSQALTLGMTTNVDGEPAIMIVHQDDPEPLVLSHEEFEAMLVEGQDVYMAHGPDIAPVLTGPDGRRYVLQESAGRIPIIRLTPFGAPGRDIYSYGVTGFTVTGTTAPRDGREVLVPAYARLYTGDREHTEVREVDVLFYREMGRRAGLTEDTYWHFVRDNQHGLIRLDFLEDRNETVVFEIVGGGYEMAPQEDIGLYGTAIEGELRYTRDANAPRTYGIGRAFEIPYYPGESGPTRYAICTAEDGERLIFVTPNRGLFPSTVPPPGAWTALNPVPMTFGYEPALDLAERAADALNESAMIDSLGGHMQVVMGNDLSGDNGDMMGPFTRIPLTGLKPVDSAYAGPRPSAFDRLLQDDDKLLPPELLK